MAEERTNDQSDVAEADPTARLAGRVSAALELNALDEARVLVSGLRARDLAEVIEMLQPDQRVALIQALGTAFDLNDDEYIS